MNELKDWAKIFLQTKQNELGSVLFNFTYRKLAKKMPEILGISSIDDISAIEYICKTPNNSEYPSRSYTDSFEFNQSTAREELERMAKENQDFKAYFERLPRGSRVSLTFIGKGHKVMGSRDYIK